MFKKIKDIVIWIGIFLIPISLLAQEDVASKEAMLIEQENINFQTFFFESLKQKAIGNYDKAIYALEACNNINKESIAILFELSKNHFLLNKYTEAEYYILKGLEIEPLNIYMLRYLKEIKTKKNDYKGAINIQQKIVAINPSEEADLVILYIKSGEIEKAISVIKKLDKKDNLPSHLVALKESLIKTTHVINEKSNSVFNDQPKSKIELLKDNYNLKKDFNSLKLVLERELKTKQYLNLLKDSKEAVSLYPAQPYVYLMNGVALNSLRKYKEAIIKLEIGLEFIVDDNKMEAQFMEQLSLSYKGLGQNKTATSYYKKVLDLRKQIKIKHD